jgi:DNA-binding LytR/AlgR family response regulator
MNMGARLIEMNAENNLHIPAVLESFTTDSNKKVFFKKGNIHIGVRLMDITCFYTESSIVFALTKDGLKCLAEKNLAELEAQLDNRIFFRANRKFIINGRHIKSFRTIDRVRIQVEIEVKSKQISVIIAQKRVSKFRNWITAL